MVKMLLVAVTNGSNTLATPTFPARKQTAEPRRLEQVALHMLLLAFEFAAFGDRSRANCQQGSRRQPTRMQPGSESLCPPYAMAGTNVGGGAATTELTEGPEETPEDGHRVWGYHETYA